MTVEPADTDRENGKSQTGGRPVFESEIKFEAYGYQTHGYLEGSVRESVMLRPEDARRFFDAMSEWVTELTWRNTSQPDGIDLLPMVLLTWDKAERNRVRLALTRDHAKRRTFRTVGVS